MNIHTEAKFATLNYPQHCGAGFVHDENDNSLPADQFVCKTGKVIEADDTAYDVEYPTGEEPIFYLVDFDGQRVWVEGQALTFQY